VKRHEDNVTFGQPLVSDCFLCEFSQALSTASDTDLLGQLLR